MDNLFDDILGDMLDFLSSLLPVWALVVILLLIITLVAIFGVSTESQEQQQPPAAMTGPQSP